MMLGLARSNGGGKRKVQPKGQALGCSPVKCPKNANVFADGEAVSLTLNGLGNQGDGSPSVTCVGGFRTYTANQRRASIQYLFIASMLNGFNLQFAYLFYY